MPSCKPLNVKALGAWGARKSLILSNLWAKIFGQKETRPTTRRVSTLSHLPLTNYKVFNFVKFEAFDDGGRILIVRNALQVKIFIMLHDCAVCVGSAPWSAPSEAVSKFNSEGDIAAFAVVSESSKASSLVGYDFGDETRKASRFGILCVHVVGFVGFSEVDHIVKSIKIKSFGLFCQVNFFWFNF